MNPDASPAVPAMGAEQFAFWVGMIPQLVWTTDATGFHLYFNQRWTGFTGCTLANSVGPDMWNNPLHHVLHNRQGLRVAVIVNDMSEINIDAALVSGGAGLSRTTETLVEMTNGCICCTLRDDLLLEVSRLARERRFDYLLIESSGISEPMPVAATFAFADEHGASLADVARLDTMVTVIDAARFLDDLGSLDDLQDRRLAADAADERSLGDLLMAQVEFADLLVVNKADLVGGEDLCRVKALLASLNPDALVVESIRGAVPLELLLHTGRFSMERAEQAPGWIKELNGEHTPETEEYGISSFVYRARRPFHPQRLEDLLDAGFDGVLRAKGFLWLSSCHDDAILFSIAGRTVMLEPQARWLAATGDPEPHDAETLLYMRSVWQEPHGDRRQELVFIGMDMCKETIERSLEAALLSVEEMQDGPTVWAAYTDPFAEMFRDVREQVAA